MSKSTQPGKIRRAYEFIKAHRRQYDVRTMCRVLDVAPSGYYAWLREPVSNRAQEDARLLRLLRASFTASHGIYGSPRVFLDLREAGETCSKHRVAHLGGMAVPRHRDGFVFQEDRWLVHKTDYSSRARAGCCNDGCETTTAPWNDCSFGPGVSIR